MPSHNFIPQLQFLVMVSAGKVDDETTLTRFELGDAGTLKVDSLFYADGLFCQIQQGIP